MATITVAWMTGYQDTYIGEIDYFDYYICITLSVSGTMINIPFTAMKYWMVE